MAAGDTGSLLEDIDNIEQLATDLGKTPRTIRRWMNEPDGIPHGYLGGQLIFHRPSVRRWIESKFKTPNPTRRPRRSA